MVVRPPRVCLFELRASGREQADRGQRMSWLAWIIIVAALLALFVLWDLIFCDGKRCRGLIDRVM